MKNNYIFLKILFPFIIGILIGLSPLFCFHFRLIYFLIALSILSYLSFISLKFQTYSLRWLSGFFISLIFVITGYYLTISNYDNRKPDYFGNYITSQKNYAIIIINEPPEIKERYVKAIADVKYFSSNLHFIRTTGKLLLSIRRDSSSEKLRYGDRLIINAGFSEISSPKDKYAVNYKRYFAFKNIYHRAYLISLNFCIIDSGHVNPVFYYAYKTRDRLISILEQNGVSGKELAVGASILFGYRDKLDAETIREYSNAGVMHILCVSGLNVGLLYIVLKSLLFFLDKRRNLRIIKFIIILLSIWFYTFVCGLAPSILRASVMFSLLLLGKLFNKDSEIFNTLIISAFVLLLFNPFLIGDVGFQLSYLSVAAIVLLCPYFEKIIKTENKIIEGIWALISMSFAAQIGVFPLVLYYFHFFPLLFIISNIIIIPVVFIITYAGTSLLFLNAFIISVVAAKIFIILIRFINHTVWSIEQTPFSTLNNIYITVPQFLLLYLIIILLSITFIRRSKRLLFTSLITTTILAITFAF